MTEDIAVPVERGVPAAVRHNNQIRTWFEGALVVLLVAALLIAGWAARSADNTAKTVKALERAATLNACSNRLLADFAAANGRALAAPPAPNTNRLAAVADIARSAQRLANSDRICAHGVPKPLIPTPEGP